MTSSQSQAVFGSVFVFPSRVALGSIFTLILMSFLFLFRVPFAVSAYFGVLSNFLTRFFSTPFTSFTSCFFGRSVSFILFSLKTLSPQTWIITISSRWQSFSSTGIVALQVGYDLQNTKNYYSTANSPIIIVRVAYNLLTRLHIIMPTWSSRAKCLTVCPRYFTLRLDTRICACALPSPSPFHYVMAQLFPVVQLAAHAKSSTMYGRS